MKYIKKLPLVYFVILPIFLGLFVLPLMHRGMFIDGEIYAIISRNWAEGIGDTWHLYGDNLQAFYGHPPLFFVLEGFFFKVFGDYFWVESLFNILLALGFILLLWQIIRAINQNLLKTIDLHLLKFKHLLVPYVIVIFLAANEVAHTFTSNLLDTLLGFFTLLTVYFSLCAYQKNSFICYLYYALAGISIFLGYLTKGPVAMYPLVVPSLLFFFFKGKYKWKGLLWSFYVLVVALSCMGILFLLEPESFMAIKLYHEIQVFPALKTNISKEFIDQGGRGFNAYYWHERPWVWFKVVFVNILGSLFLFSGLLFAYLHFIVAKRRKIDYSVFKEKPYRKLFFFGMMLFFSVSLPLMLSPYIVARYGLPISAIVAPLFAYLLTPLLSQLYLPGVKILRGILLTLSLGILLVGIIRWGEPSRDPRLIKVVDMVSKYIKPREFIFADDLSLNHLNNIESSRLINNNMFYHLYFERYANIYLRNINSIDTVPRWLLLHQDIDQNLIVKNKFYKPMDRSNCFVLYRLDDR